MEAISTSDLANRLKKSDGKPITDAALRAWVKKFKIPSNVEAGRRLFYAEGIEKAETICNLKFHTEPPKSDDQIIEILNGIEAEIVEQDETEERGLSIIEQPQSFAAAFMPFILELQERSEDLGSREQAIESITEQLEMSRQEVERLRADRDVHLQEIGRLREQNAQSQQNARAMHEIQSKLSESEKHVETARKEIEAIRQSNESLKREDNSKSSRLREQNERIEELESEKREKDKKILSLSSESQRLSAELEKTKALLPFWRRVKT